MIDEARRTAWIKLKDVQYKTGYLQFEATFEAGRLAGLREALMSAKGECADELGHSLCRCVDYIQAAIERTEGGEKDE